MEVINSVHAGADIKALRASQRAHFLAATEWHSWSMAALGADASFRRYFRLSSGSENVLLMDSPPDKEDIGSYRKVDSYLLGAGLRAPKILALDEANGFAIIEDFGHQTYTQLLNRGVEAQPLYQLAVDVLVHLHKQLPINQLDLPRYDDGYYEDEASLFVDWYWPARTGQIMSASLRNEFLAIWRNLLGRVSTEQECMVLRDYHVDNLMLIDGESGIQSCGLLDFQDALIGSCAYDLVSLFEDARRVVDPAMSMNLLNDYLKDFSAFEKQSFMYAYRVLGAHRHIKVIGIFVRLCVRDNKAHYLDYLPHVQRLLERSLNAVELKPLADWLAVNHPGSVVEPLLFDVERVRLRVTEHFSNEYSAE